MLFTTTDIVLLVLYLLACGGVGLMSARRSGGGGGGGGAEGGHGGESKESYFLAGRNANVWVTGMSLLSGLSSGISFLGIPGFAFEHGLEEIWQVAAFIPVTAGVALVTVPFFQRGGFVTSYAYLQARFASPLRTVAAVAFVLRIGFYLALVLYAPALAIAEVTGLSIWVSITACGSMATAYTMKGGMSAVIATDFMQSVTLIIGSTLCLGLAVQGVRGGEGSIWDILREHRGAAAAKAGGAGNEDFYPGGAAGWHPYRKQDVWSMTLGYLFNGLGQNGVDQIAVQRYLSAGNGDSTTPIVLGGALNALSLASLTTLGIAIYAYYETRQALLPGGLPGDITKSDQVFPYFFVHDAPDGVGGILTAALFGTTMSVMSGGLNAGATSIITDLYQNALGRMRDAPDAEVVAASKKITLVLGVFSVVLAFLAQLIGQSLILMSAAVQGLFCGPTLGIFLLGMCSTRANAQGALLGYGAGFLVLAVLVVGQAVCSSRPDGDAACAPGGSLHRLTISEWYYGVVGCLVSVVVGYGASLRWAPPTNLEGLTFFTLEGAKGKGGKTEARSGGGGGGGGGGGNRLASAAEPLLRDD